MPFYYPITKRSSLHRKYEINNKRKETILALSRHILNSNPRHMRASSVSKDSNFSNSMSMIYILTKVSSGNEYSSPPYLSLEGFMVPPPHKEIPYQVVVNFCFKIYESSKPAHQNVSLDPVKSESLRPKE